MKRTMTQSRLTPSRLTQSFMGAVATAAGLALLGTSPAIAGPTLGGWTYGVDSWKDGMSGYLGGSYEIYGLGVYQDGDTITVGIDGRLPLAGEVHSGKHIGWGDLFFNFGSNQTSLAANQGNLFALHFAQNDAGDAGITAGLYSGVTGKNVGLNNYGYASVAAHANQVSSLGGTPSVGDLSSYDSYWTGSNYNVIGSGTRVGNVNVLGSAALAGLGFNLNAVAGSQVQSTANGAVRQTFGLQFQRTDAMVGNFVAHLFAECLNDGVAVKGSLAANPTPVVPPAPEQKVPEPTALLGLGAVLGWLKLRRNG